MIEPMQLEARGYRHRCYQSELLCHILCILDITIHAGTHTTIDMIIRKLYKHLRYSFKTYATYSMILFLIWFVDLIYLNSA